MRGPSQHFIHQEQRGNWSRIWQCSGLSYANISSIIMHDLSMSLLTPHVLFHPHSSMGDTHCMWDASSVEWHGTFSPWDLILPQVSHNMPRICARLRRLQYYIYLSMNIPQKVIVVCWKSKVRYDTPKYPFWMKEPPETVTFNWQNFHVWCQNCGYSTTYTVPYF